MKVGVCYLAAYRFQLAAFAPWGSPRLARHGGGSFDSLNARGDNRLARRWLGRLTYWIASVLAAISLCLAVYVGVAEQRRFNWPVAGVFAALGIGIWLVGWTISRLLQRL